MTRSPHAIRAARIAVLCALFVHVLNPPDVIPLPEPAQIFFEAPPTPPQVPPVDVRLLVVTRRKGWEAERIVVTYESLRTDPLVWRGMFFRDWDGVPRALREASLAPMTARYRRLVDAPRTWRGMDASDWDEVPQPIRAMAFMNMIARWERCQDLAGHTGIEEAALVARLRAVAMGESWFEHRALGENANGSSDLGLAQATTATRSILRWRAARGIADFGFTDDEYFDPLNGSRVLVYWFGLMLDETGRDLDRATRAYHVGSGSAWRGHGTEYLEGVQRLEERFMGAASPSPAWRWLRQRTVDAAGREADDDENRCLVDRSG